MLNSTRGLRRPAPFDLTRGVCLQNPTKVYSDGVRGRHVAYRELKLGKQKRELRFLLKIDSGASGDGPHPARHVGFLRETSASALGGIPRRLAGPKNRLIGTGHCDFIRIRRRNYGSRAPPTCHVAYVYESPRIYTLK